MRSIELQPPKMVEQELARKKTGRRGHPGNTTPRKVKSGTVSSLRPAPAIIILETSRIVQAAQLMAAKRTDAVLVVNNEGGLCGILTDKDIAYRVVAPGLDVRTTLVSSVMTKEPISVYDKGNRNEALSVMVSRRFRHLPVISDSNDPGEDDGDDDPSFEAGTSTSVVGLLDITKCVFERLDDLERKVNEDENIISAMEALERRGSVASDHVGLMRSQHGCPDVGTILSQMDIEHMDSMVPEISIKATVRDAAKAMKENNQTAVLVSAGEMDERIGGICTTKDIVLRVLAASLDPSTTSVVRVMTPHPDSISVETSILDALKKLHSGHYLHLPVVDHGTPVGLIDMMTLTISMLTYLASKDGVQDATTPTESGPMWNRFWNSTFAGSNNETESDHLSAASDSIPGSSVSASYPPPPAPTERSQSSATHLSRRQSSMYAYDSPVAHYRHHDEMSHGAPSTMHTRSVIDEGYFPFKLRDGRNGKVYRFTARVDSMNDLVSKVFEKCGVDATASTVEHKFNYMDDEGDVIAIASDKDLEEGVDMARAAGWKRLMIFYGDVPTNTIGSFSRAVDIDDSVSSASASSSPLVRRRTFQRSGTSEIMDERAMVIRNEAGPVVPAKEENEVIKFLRDAPLPINVAISTGIVMVMGVIFVKMIK
ncbi:hypothetical protein PhCBS80983_g00496 [Powellomyces hirtus]|uniref:CBS domain-containing protein n=1 Tax=Powellomyces hirtus TaxID=109895 RepID=A0A507EFS5_9FUNG|nr:hypothetical protein PhCBS80983_g00496 [Powellomyces hirtus]